MPKNTAPWIILAAIYLFPVAGNAVDTDADRPRSLQTLGGVREPWIQAELAPATRRRLSAAFSTALLRLRRQASCRQLFETFGVDGVEVLARTFYYRASARDEQLVCRGAAAFTSVRGRVTRVCRSFRLLTEDQAAVVLIHEALHQAGMDEKPRDPGALDSAQINDLVAASCML